MSSKIQDKKQPTLTQLWKDSDDDSLITQDENSNNEDTDSVFEDISNEDNNIIIQNKNDVKDDEVEDEGENEEDWLPVSLPGTINDNDLAFNNDSDRCN